jgi:hypothetical protein
LVSEHPKIVIQIFLSSLLQYISRGTACMISRFLRLFAN